MLPTNLTNFANLPFATIYNSRKTQMIIVMKRREGYNPVLSINRGGQESVNNINENLKSPGIDGIICKFSELYWEAIEKDCFEVVNQVFHNFELNNSQ